MKHSNIPNETNIESQQIWIRRVRVRVRVGETNIESEKIWIRRVRVRVRVRVSVKLTKG